MLLYNLHTHHPSVADECDCQIVDILNTDPNSFMQNKGGSIGVFHSCGIHPWYATNIDGELQRLEKILQDDSVIAIGEIGLDKLKGGDLEIQKIVFKKQIELSVEFNIPVIIHCVKAWDDLISIYKRYKPKQSWIIHGFRGNRYQATQLCDLGFKISIGERYNVDALSSIPLKMLFCETDTSKKSIFDIYKMVARDLDVRVDSLSRMIRENFESTFRLTS